MSEGLRELRDRDLDEALEDLLAPRLTATILARDAGHCAKVTQLPAAASVGLCTRLRSAVGRRAQVHVLGRSPDVPDHVAVTSTKLIELRNPDDAGRRQPLLIFVPPGTKASVEDSFDVATFEEIVLGDVYRDLTAQLLAEFSGELRHGIEELFAVIDDEVPFVDWYSRARYLLTLKLNDHDPAAAGAAVFELGLIPDFELFADTAEIRGRAARNRRQLVVLVDGDRPARQRVVELGLTQASFRARLAEFLVRHGVHDSYAWTRRIVVDRANWPLAFQNWPVGPDRADVDIRVRIEVAPLALPIAGSSPTHAENRALAAITGQQFLAGDTRSIALPVEFDVDPDPRTVAGLAKFTVTLVSESAGSTGRSTSIQVSRTGKTRYRVTLKKLRPGDLEEGWHFLRVLPVDVDAIPLPVATDHSGAHPSHESERFYVLTDEAIDDPTPPGTAAKDVGITHALRRLEFDSVLQRDAGEPAVRTVAWQDGKATLRGWLGAHRHVEIPLSPELAAIECAILARPDDLRHRRLTVRAGTVEQAGQVGEDLSVEGDTVVRFREARSRVFAAIRGVDNMVVEGRDLSSHRADVEEYAESYYEMLRRQLLAAERADAVQLPTQLELLSAMLRIDTIEVDHYDGRGDRTELTLVAPTHPLRLLWLVTWSELGIRWCADARACDEVVAAATASSHAALRPLGFPLAVPRDGGRLAVAGGDLNPYWGVCLPTDVAEPRRVLGDLRRTLAVPERKTDPRAAEVVSGRRLADRVERYLRLHPYVHTVVISIVNGGDGEPLADMLIDLQQRKGLHDLAYEITLFSAEPESPTEGIALARLLRGEWRDTVAAETFHARRDSAMAPKLAVAIRPVDEFRSPAGARYAHLCFLFDAFSGEEFGAVEADRPAVLPVHGLVQDVEVTYLDDGDTVTWRKYPRHGRAEALAHREELTDTLAAIPEVVSNAVCAVSTGQAGVALVPAITLSLDVGDSTLLHQAHQSSDWVITVDRTLGVEYFDNPAGTRRSDYVIDVEDSITEGLGHHVVVTSRSMDELCALLAPVIDQHKLRVDPRHARTFFDQLRLLSGRLAFKIASTAPNQRTEVLGLALARLFLDYQGVLADQILIPLDAHLELYREVRNADEIGEAVGLQRTDLALFSLDARQRTITARLVEVKCHSAVTLADYSDLKSKMAGQLDQSAEILARNFDPSRTQPDRPDRFARNSELRGLLRFYLNRAVRHGVVTQQVAAEARWLLDRLDREPSYRLDFTRTGLIFDLAGTGVSSETEGGVEFHLIGRDVMEELLDAVPTILPAPTRLPEMVDMSLSRLDLTLPRLARAGFRSATRDHEPAADEQDPDEDAIPERPAAATVRSANSAADPSPHRPNPMESHPLSRTKPVGGQRVSEPEVFVGTTRPSPQFGVIAEAAGQKIALDLNETHTISLFGVQGGGKSYTLGTIIEAACLSRPPVNELPRPLATIVFHYSPTLDYAPEFTSMIRPNDNPEQMETLKERYGATPAGLKDVLMLVPEDQLTQRRTEYPGIEVRPLKFGSAELRAEHWRFLMGAIGNQATYIRQLQRLMKANRHDLRLATIRDGIDHSSLSDSLKQLAQQRLDLAADYIDDDARIKQLVRPGRMIIVDLRDEFIEKDEALGLFVVLMQLFAEAQDAGQRFNKLVVFDEAHKYIESPDLVAGLVESVREMRHKGMSVLVASQDPPSVPIALIELSSQIILHKFTSPAWLKHLQKANASLADLTASKMAGLTQGEAYVWSSKATDEAFTKGALRIRMRPRLSAHGGGTKTAVD